MHEPATDLPLVSGAVPGIGGKLKHRPEDFVVSELPLFEPQGDGPHLYLSVRRAGFATRDVVAELARILATPARDIGYAGLKDKQAVATQTFSVYAPQADPAEVEARLQGHPHLELLALRRHPHKLRVGRAGGNHFRLMARGCRPESQEQVRAKLHLLERVGFPNYFGAQRFGRSGDNARRGERVLLGRERISGWMGRFLVSAFQSHLFNLWLAARIRDGLYRRVLEGDLVGPGHGGPAFIVEDVPREQARLDDGALVIQGPLFGRELPQARGPAREREQQILDSLGRGVARRLLGPKGPTGSRRPASVVPADLRWEPYRGGDAIAEAAGIAIEFEFTLPSGSFATVIMRELMSDDEAPSMPELVILDRDGVLNEDSDDYIRSVREWQPIPGSMRAVGRLTRAGIRVAVATNQSGLARGYFDEPELDAMHARLTELVEAEGGRIERIIYCPHLPTDGCDCRKPKPGMLLRLLSELGVTSNRAAFVGDTLKDVQAARAAGVVPFLVLTGKGSRIQAAGELPEDVPVFANLSAFVDDLLPVRSAAEE